MLSWKLVVIAALFSLNIAASAIDTTDARDLNEFALKCSEAGLWREAEFRLKRAIEISDNDARLHNNLAVALEAQGKLDEAYTEYLLAVNLDARNNKYGYNLDKFIKTHKWDVQEDTDSPNAE